MLLLGAVVTLVAVDTISWENPLSGLLGGEEISDQGPVVVQSVRNLSELTTVEVVESTTIESGTDTGLLNFATGDRIFLFAVARISAGVDLGQVGPDDVVINEEANSIILTLPSPTITAVEMDNEQTRVYDRDTGLFTSGDVDLEREARLAAEDVMVEAAIQDGIRARARDSSQLAMEELLTSLGYDQVIVRFAPAD